MSIRSSSSPQPGFNSQRVVVQTGGLVVDPDAVKKARAFREERQKAKERLDIQMLENFMVGFSSGA